MRAIAAVLVVLLLSACAGTMPLRSTGTPAGEAGPCGRSGIPWMEPGSAHSAQAADGELTVAIALIWLILGLAGAIAGCPQAAAGADATPS